jgi:hypothetical protein
MAFTSTVVVETVDTTEHDLITDAAYSSATMQAAARFSTVIDVSAMTAAEEYRFRVYSHDGTTALVVWEATRIGAQNEPVRTPEFMLNAWAVTADKIAGTARSLRSITLREDSAPTAAAVAAAVVAATVLRTGTATAGDLSSITLDAGAPTTVDLFKGAIIEIISGTGAGQCETITSYTAGRRAYVTSFVTAPDGTSVYIIRGAPGRLIISVRDDLARVLGISKDNAMLDRTVYSGGKMTGARLRVFGDASELAAATADTPSDNDDGEIQRYTVAATYSGDDLVSYSMVREL